jgi:26S proteasome regulatory subunit N5
MISHALHEDQYLNICKFYREIYDTPCIKEDQAKLIAVSNYDICLDSLTPAGPAERCYFLHSGAV